MKKALIIIILAMLAGCSSKDFGYRYGDLPKAYYPKRYRVNVGPITLMDVQVIKKR